MSTPKGYGVILQTTLPPPLLEMLEKYIHHDHGNSFVLSSIFEESIHFASVSIHKTDAKNLNEPWKLRLPISCVLAVVEVSKPDSPLGFVP